MKAVFEYNPVNGEIRDKNGVIVFMMGMTPFDIEKEVKSDINTIKELKAAGFETEDILKLKREGVI